MRSRSAPDVGRGGVVDDAGGDHLCSAFGVAGGGCSSCLPASTSVACHRATRVAPCGSCPARERRQRPAHPEPVSGLRTSVNLSAHVRNDALLSLDKRSRRTIRTSCPIRPPIGRQGAAPAHRTTCAIGCRASTASPHRARRADPGGPTRPAHESQLRSEPVRSPRIGAVIELGLSFAVPVPVTPRHNAA